LTGSGVSESIPYVESGAPPWAGLKMVISRSGEGLLEASMLRMLGNGPSRWLQSIRCRRRLQLEELESRTLLTGYAPSQILHAYGFDRLPYDGSGQTIAIVTAYDNSGVTYDLGVFDQLFGLPDPVLTIAQPQGQPSYDEGWGLETDLDVQWAHAIAPAANILLVEAKTPSFFNLLAAVDYARKQPGVVAVSMSWAYGDFFNETQYDSHFTTPSGHIGGSGLPGGITFVAASGDSGAGVAWPAVSPNVLSIGGTSLTLDDNNQIVSETGWSASGGGVSNYEPEPAYQAPFQTFGMRSTPDFSYNADPSSAFWVYDSAYGGTTGVYGTSAGAPQWAALVALVDQGLALNNIGSLDGRTQTIPALYNLAKVSYGTYYHDIIDGNNGYQAGPGYDLVTGIGSPVADLIVQALVNGAQSPSGGGRRSRGWSLGPLSRADVTRITSSPVSSSRPVPVPTPLLGHPSRTAGSTLLKLGDSVNQTAGLLLAAMVQPVSATSQVASGLTSSPSEETQALDGDAAAPRLQPDLTYSSSLPKRRHENGGGDNAGLADDLEDNGPADTRVPPISDSTSGAASFAPTRLRANESAFSASGSSRL
jgi:hypothetical protein